MTRSMEQFQIEVARYGSTASDPPDHFAGVATEASGQSLDVVELQHELAEMPLRCRRRPARSTDDDGVNATPRDGVGLASVAD